MKQNILSEKCNAFLDQVMNLNDLPGLAIGVSIGLPDSAGSGGSGAVSFIGVRGYRDFPAKTPLGENDIFHCASVSKLFTSSAIMKLVEAGVLHPEDNLRDILPALRIADKRYEEIRLRHMLTHTSGLGDVDDYCWQDFETDEDSLRRYVYGSTDVTGQPMLWSPRENRFRYSNVAYEILGQIVAEYAGSMPDADQVSAADAAGNLSYEDFVAAYLLEPAGMTASTMKTFDRPGAPDFAGEAAASMARPHEKKADRSIGLVQYYPYTRQHAPSSTLTSNVRDLLRWGRAHLASAGGHGPLLKPETYRSIWRSYAIVPNNGEHMGLGWFLREQTVSSGSVDSSRAYSLCGHEGTDDGFRASFWLCLELDLVCVVLSNLSGAPVKRINKQLFETIVQSELSSDPV